MGLGIAAGPDPAPLAGVAAGLEEIGYESAWTNDSASGSGLAMLRAWAPGTHEITLAVGVLALDRHTPASIAADVAEMGLPRERLLIGLGAGFQQHPVEAVRAGVEELRRLLPGVRLAVAAMGPRMCALAGEVGDAVLLNWMTPERAAWARELVGGHATVYGYVRVAVGPDSKARLAREAEHYTQIPHYQRHFEAMGGDPGHVGIAVADAADLPQQLEAYAALDVPVVRALTERSEPAILELARAATGEAVTP